MRARGAALEVGVVVELLAQDGRRRGSRVAEDLDDGLELAGDVVLQEAGGHDGRARASVAVEQRPVVEHEPFTVLQAHGENAYEGGYKATVSLNLMTFTKRITGPLLAQEINLPTY